MMQKPNFDYKGFMADFAIADAFGEKAVEDTYRRALREWKDNVQYFASLVMTLNHRLWGHYNEGDEDMARLYDRLWSEAHEFGSSHFKGDDATYYFDFLD